MKRSNISRPGFFMTFTTSFEMCSGAIFLSGIRRVVFGLDAVRMRQMRGLKEEYRDLAWSIKEIYQASPHPIECIGPALIDEASESHIGFWQP